MTEHPGTGTPSQPPAVAFVQPAADWQTRFDQAAMRVLLVLLDTALQAGSRELLLVTVRQHHLSALIVPDREPLEIAQLNLRYYDGIRAFLQQGLFANTTHPLITWHESTFSLTLELVERPGGEGVSISWDAAATA